MGKKFVIFSHHALSVKALVLSSLLQRLHDGVDGASSSVAVTDGGTRRDNDDMDLTDKERSGITRRHQRSLEERGGVNIGF